MRQLVIISGKGGTGKTVITGALAALAKNKVIADCDVDAADLHLLLKPRMKEKHTFKSGTTAFIDRKKCVECGRCREICRFNAIKKDFWVDVVSCEGCAFCSYICPAGAIKMKENVAGQWFISNTHFGPLVHAKLGVAEENSGKLVSMVRQKAKEIAENKNCDWIIIDGSPGIGCPVIASISGVDCALVVTEPTLSGLHDAKRVIGVATYFKIPVTLAINKYDLNIEISKKIEKYCKDNAIRLVGKIRFDKSIVKAMTNGKTIIEHAKRSPARHEIENLWHRLQKE